MACPLDAARAAQARAFDEEEQPAGVASTTWPAHRSTCAAALHAAVAVARHRSRRGSSPEAEAWTTCHGRWATCLAAATSRVAAACLDEVDPPDLPDAPLRYGGGRDDDGMRHL